MKNKDIWVAAAIIGALFLWSKRAMGGTGGGTPQGTKGHTYNLPGGGTAYVAADPNNVLMRNKLTGQQTWIPNAVVAEYLKYGEWEII